MKLLKSKFGSKNVRSMIGLMKKNNYTVYDRPYELNIVGVRADSVKPDSFDDLMMVWYKDNEGNLIEHEYPITTDPSTYWLANPSMPKGTAILKQGQYKDSWSQDLHQGKYLALKQSKPVTVLRQYNRENVLDFLNGTPDTGLFGINIHRANQEGVTKTIGKYSAGCQVFANADDFNDFMAMTSRQKELYGNKFTYTLFDARAKRRGERRRLIIGGAVIIAGVTIAVALVLHYKKS